MFFSRDLRKGKSARRTLSMFFPSMRACIRLFYIILDNFPLVRAPAQAYFFPFIRFLYRSILLTSIFLSPFAKYGLFFHSLPSLFRQSSHSASSHPQSSHTLVSPCVSPAPLSAFMYLHTLHCRHDIVQV